MAFWAIKRFVEVKNMEQHSTSHLFSLIQSLYSQTSSAVFICNAELELLWKNAAGETVLSCFQKETALHLGDVFDNIDLRAISQSIHNGEPGQSSFLYACNYQVVLTSAPLSDETGKYAIVTIYCTQTDPVSTDSFGINTFQAINSQSYRNAMFGIFNIISVLSNTFDQKNMYKEMPYLNALAYNCYSIMRTNINVGAYCDFLNPANSNSLKKERVYMNKFCRLFAENVSRLLSSSEIEFEYNIDDQMVTTMADLSKLSIALLNIIHNSCVFTSPGNTIQFSFKKSENSYIITISDKGTGIPPEKLSKVFDPFFSDPSLTDTTVGNGLGLTVAKKIVEAHHGICMITSELYHGTTVSIRCPIEDDPSKELSLSAPASPYRAQRLSNENIFLAEIGNYVCY